MESSHFVKRIVPEISLILMGLLVACGGAEDEGSARIQSDVAPLGQLVLKAFSPIEIHLNPTTVGGYELVPTDRVLALAQYDRLVEPDLSADRLLANSVITGVAMSGVDLSGNALNITLALEAREYDSKTGLFSTDTRLFFASGADFQGGQRFVITNTDTPNRLLTGLAFRFKNARLNGLQLQRRAIETLDRASVYARDNTSNAVTLPANWAAVGVWIKLRTQDVITDQTKIPFVQDALIYTSMLAKE